jgi:hypothetical protein
MTTSNNEPSILSEDKKDWISLIDESVHHMMMLILVMYMQ